MTQQSKELDIKKLYLITYSGAKFLITNEQADKIVSLINAGAKVIKISENNYMGVSDFKGIYDSKNIEDDLRRKNGQWKCEYGTWHDKGQECGCGIAKQYGL